MSGKKTYTTNAPDPAAVQRGVANYDNLQGFAGSPFQPYTGEMAAPMNATQSGAGGILGQYMTNQPGSVALSGGILGATNAMGYTPQQIMAGQLSNTDLSPYLNPYQNDVINASIAENERARQQAQVTNNQAATAANAFGGSRSGVMGALTNEAYDRNDQSSIAGLNQQNYQQAQQAALSDIQARMQAASQNAANGLSANAQALQGAGILGNLGNSQYSNAMTAANAYLGYGNQQQQTQQNADQANLDMWKTAYEDPFLKQQLLNQTLGIIPTGSTSTSGSSNSFLANMLFDPGLGLF